MKPSPSQRPLLLAALTFAAALLAACVSSYRTPPVAPPTKAQTPAPQPDAARTALPEPPLTAATPVAPVAPLAPLAAGAAVTPVTLLPAVSSATTALAYRRDAATHLYAHNAARIYKGMLKPHLYAIGVLDVDIDRNGQVIGVSWRRAPRHAPEVMAEIIRTVRQAAPYPQPVRMGRVTYTEVWLWDKSGQFQLDTLTEGQL